MLLAFFWLPKSWMTAGSWWAVGLHGNRWGRNANNSQKGVPLQLVLHINSPRYLGKKRRSAPLDNSQPNTDGVYQIRYPLSASNSHKGSRRREGFNLSARWDTSPTYILLFYSPRIV